ncbi:MAG: hypothetical protein ACK58L_16075 [Planctomycetota bacterium]
MVQATRDAVQFLLSEAIAGLSDRQQHGVAVKEQSRRIVKEVESSLAGDASELISIQQEDLTALHELARANQRIRAHWLIRLLQTHLVASWLAAVPMATAGLVTGAAESVLMALAAPLLSGYLIYVYLPLRLLSYCGSILLSFIQPSSIRPRLIDREDYGMAFSIEATMLVLPLLWPCWLIVRQSRTGRPAGGAWIAVGRLLAAQVAILIAIR